MRTLGLISIDSAKKITPFYLSLSIFSFLCYTSFLIISKLSRFFQLKKSRQKRSEKVVNRYKLYDTQHFRLLKNPFRCYWVLIFLLFYIWFDSAETVTSCPYQNKATQGNSLFIFAVNLPFRAGVMYNTFNLSSGFKLVWNLRVRRKSRFRATMLGYTVQSCCRKINQ